MSDYQVVQQQFIVDGQPVEVNLINNPTVYDVMITEEMIAAYEIINGPLSGHRVSRSLRDYFIKTGVQY